jgi:hypothetical protein
MNIFRDKQITEKSVIEKIEDSLCNFQDDIIKLVEYTPSAMVLHKKIEIIKKDIISVIKEIQDES